MTWSQIFRLLTLFVSLISWVCLMVATISNNFSKSFSQREEFPGTESFWDISMGLWEGCYTKSVTVYEEIPGIIPPDPVDFGCLKLSLLPTFWQTLRGLLVGNCAIQSFDVGGKYLCLKLKLGKYVSGFVGIVSALIGVACMVIALAWFNDFCNWMFFDAKPNFQMSSGFNLLISSWVLTLVFSIIQFFT